MAREIEWESAREVRKGMQVIAKLFVMNAPEESGDLVCDIIKEVQSFSDEDYKYILEALFSSKLHGTTALIGHFFEFIENHGNLHDVNDITNRIERAKSHIKWRIETEERFKRAERGNEA